jgi:hypothetical protein
MRCRHINALWHVMWQACHAVQRIVFPADTVRAELRGKFLRAANSKPTRIAIWDVKNFAHGHPTAKPI